MSCLCLPGWEPFIEPWPCFLSWQQQAAGRLHPPRLKMGIRAKQRLDVNITSVLLGGFRLEHPPLHTNKWRINKILCWFPVPVLSLYSKSVILNMHLCTFLEQYNTTKSSWIADYCNEEDQTPQCSPPEPWMGSSVDPPSFGQSECHTVSQIHNCIIKNIKNIFYCASESLFIFIFILYI